MINDSGPYGAYDMLGNLYEWVDDKWSDDHSEAKPDGSSTGTGFRCVADIEN